ncbi:MAG: iron hydrogenase small subunit, partial [Clostridia bacterium]|nr:iron hydrogenase small subunit [Clostridia bacterium]
EVKSGKAHCDYIEMMACPGGCVNGGGQPIHSADYLSDHDLKALRAKALYQEDVNAELRKSHENPVIKELYDNFLGEPCGKMSHKLLHTKYTKRDKY